MIYSVRLYLVAPGNISAFTAAFRDGGLWRELARQQLPGLIGVDLKSEDSLTRIMDLISTGAQIVLFVTGRGSVIGSPISPLIKITGNARTFAADRDPEPVRCLSWCAKPLIRNQRSTSSSQVSICVGPVDPTDLLALPFILYEYHTIMQNTIQFYFHAMDIEPKIVMELENIEAIKSLVGAGLGLRLYRHAA